MSIEDIEKKQIELQRQLLEAKELMMQVEAQLQIVYAEIQRQKIAKSSCQERFVDGVVKLKITNEETPPNEPDEMLDKEAPPMILPKPLTIKGYEDVKNFLRQHIKDIFSEDYTDLYKSNYYIEQVAKSLSKIGKELVFEKIQPVVDDDILKGWREIIETCRKINKYKENNDEQGFTKMLNFFYQKYPKPNNPFIESKPVDLFTQALSPYSEAYLIMYYFGEYNRELSAYNQNVYEEDRRERGCSHADKYAYLDYAIVIDLTEINDMLIHFMEVLYMLAVKGWKLAIVPILDENIIYRPKRVAQDGTYFSLYYYDDYVEDPQMVTDEEVKMSVPSYYASGGSTFVNGHYRSGYWRNGRYVSGGYVKGHYRS